MKTLNKVKIGVSGLTGNIHLYRHGKDLGIALEQRPAEADLVYALIEHMFWDEEEEVRKISKTIETKDGVYKITLEKMPADTEIGWNIEG